MILKITFFHVHEWVGRIFPYRLAILQSIVITLQNLSQRGFPTAFTKVKNVDIRSEKGVNEDLRITSQHAKIMYFHRAVSKVDQTWPFMSSFLQMGDIVYLLSFLTEREKLCLRSSAIAFVRSYFEYSWPSVVCVCFSLCFLQI